MPPPATFTTAMAGVYILSGVTQPLLMTLAKDAGLADPTCQLYMLFYTIGPALVSLTLLSPETVWPPFPIILRAGSIALIDILAQTMNYTGVTMSGPTLFAIIYSSVTIWAAVYSRLLLSRKMNPTQWVGVWTVFLGLVITAVDSVSVGPQVFVGSCLILVGSSMHAMTYVLSEFVMTKGGEHSLTVQMNCAAQGIVGFVVFLVWQLTYTRTHFQDLIGTPAEMAGTTIGYAAFVLGSIGVANLVHALTFFHTLKHFPGGSVSAGVMKGLQAVLVFVVGSWAFCGRTGGKEMCFTGIKFLSLLVVVGGLLVYAKATERRPDGEVVSGMKGYNRIPDENEIEQVLTQVPWWLKCTCDFYSS